MGSQYNSMPQPQFNGGMGATPYDVYGPAAAGIDQGVGQNVQNAALQAMQNQQQMQAMELRFDVRNMTPKTVQAKERAANKPLTRNQVLSSDGKVLWPGRAPSEGELGKSRAAAEAAIKVAYKEFKADGKASVQNVVEAKELLYAYGHPALEKAGWSEPSGRPEACAISSLALSRRSTRWAGSESRFSGLGGGAAQQPGKRPGEGQVPQLDVHDLPFAVDQETGRNVLDPVSLGGGIGSRPDEVGPARTLRHQEPTGCQCSRCSARPPGWPDSGRARSSRFTPRIANPRFLYSRASCRSVGNDATQGGHQVAQKSTRTTLPLRSARRTGLPSTSLPSISGAGLPIMSSRASRLSKWALMAGSARLAIASWQTLRAMSYRPP